MRLAVTHEHALLWKRVEFLIILSGYDRARSYWVHVMPGLGTPKVKMKSGQLPAGGWPGARAGWLAARVHPVTLRFMQDACMI